MLMINTNALKTNQTFKNYKELCEYLDEPIKTGKSKQLQLKDWERYFSYEKEGKKVKYIRGTDIYTPFLVGPDAGYLISNVV